MRQIEGLTIIPAYLPPVPVEVRPGQTLRVLYSFYYRSDEAFSTEIWASLFIRRDAEIYRVKQAQAKQTLTLEKAVEWTEYTGEIDILIGQIPPGLYGLLVEIPEYKQEATIDEAVSVVAVDLVTPIVWMVVLLGTVASLRIVEEEIE